jgi:hypothetical protein
MSVLDSLLEDVLELNEDIFGRDVSLEVDEFAIFILA